MIEYDSITTELAKIDKERESYVQYKSPEDVVDSLFQAELDKLAESQRVNAIKRFRNAAKTLLRCIRWPSAPSRAWQQFIDTLRQQVTFEQIDEHIQDSIKREMSEVRLSNELLKRRICAIEKHLNCISPTFVAKDEKQP